MEDFSRLLTLNETLTPSDEAGVADAVRAAVDSRTPVYPLGGLTMLGYGATAVEPGVGLSLAGLGGVVEYPARDLTITVGAGVTVAELAEELAKEGQRLPVDVPRAAKATVGGAVAAGLAGPRRFRWGTLRDYVIGLRAVDGHGHTFNAGGRVVKNAAGYNLCRLMTGSLGTVGVITQVTLMVRPVPETTAFVACNLPDHERAEELLAGLAGTSAVPSGFELLAGDGWQRAAECGLAPIDGAGLLAVGFEGTTAEVEWMIGRVCEQWAGAGAADPATVRGDAAERLWDLLTEFPADVAERDGRQRVVIEIHVLPSKVAGTVRWIAELDGGASVQAHAGDGVVRIGLSADAEEVRGLLERKLRPRISAEGGSLVVLSHPGGDGWNREVVWGPPANGAEVMGAIKKRFDPQGVLNPGRFINGNP